MKANYPLYYRGKVVALLIAWVLAAGASACGRGSGSQDEIVGEIQVDPTQILASGLPLAEVSVLVYKEGDTPAPIQGAIVMVFSSRNQDGDLVDIIEQSEQPTDAEGHAVAFIGSSEAGEATVTAEVNGEPLCERYEDGECVQAQEVVRFILECEGGLVECGGECVDTQTDADNCGECGNSCDLANAEAYCDEGVCLVGECDPGWEDCNEDAEDGCETDIIGDGENCGACGNACPEEETCIDGECSTACHDNDDDGYADEACGGTDCDDEDDSIYPGAEEVCDGVDNDCDGREDQQPQASASCNDDDPCNGLERCFRGECQDGLPIDCDDGNDCTADSCDPELECQNTVEEDGTGCGDPDDNDCDNPDTCLEGVCQPNLEPAATVCREAAGDCDITESCDGTSPDCPEDVVRPETVECREAAGDCDVAEYCDGAEPLCPSDELQPLTLECRAAVGMCDAAEYCDEVNVDCPADGVQPEATVCRAASDVCDVEELCDGINKTCSADAVAPATTECRASEGDCDPGELCNGSDKACPPDGLEPETTICREATGDCDLAEYCDGEDRDCPGDALKILDTECRPSAGGCDVVETCDGENPDCPPDVVKPDTDVCREADGVCDISEYCDGTGATCPANAVEPPTVQCRPSEDECDAAEFCDGANPDCPFDAVIPDGTLCSSDGIFCTGEEECRDGVCSSPGNPCPEPPTCDEDNDICGACGDGIISLEEICDPGFPLLDHCCDPGDCTWVLPDLPDPQEVCSGAPECRADVCDGSGECLVIDEPAGTACGNPLDTACDNPDTCLGGSCQSNLEPDTTVCRAQNGICDVAELCDGVSITCPADSVELPTTVCRVSSDDCDAVENCDGTNKTCPADDVEPPTTVCRATSGDCDVAEFCDGMTMMCPADEVEPGTAQCRAAAGPCDVSENCDGMGKDCPDDDVEPPTTICRAASDMCDVTENCDGTNKPCPPDAVEPPTTQCRAALGPCDVSENCDGVTKPCPGDGYAPSGTPCPDSDPCTDDTCDGNNNCVHVPAVDPSVNPNWECVESSCDSVDNDCDGCTDEGCGGDVIESVKVIISSDGPGLRRISGNGQFGPADRELSGRLVVQLNDGSGNPMPCEDITFAVETADTVCYGKGGTFATTHVGNDPEIIWVCNDVDTSALVGDSSLVTDENGQASVGLRLADATGTTVVSATAVSTGEKVFFAATAIPRLSPTLTLPPPEPTVNPALGPLDVTVGGDPTRPFMGNKANYTLSIDGLDASTGTTNSVASAPLEAGGTLTITGTQFTDSEPVDGSCGGAPAPGYPRVWIGGVQVTPSSVSNTQIEVPIPEGLPGAASVIVNDGTDTRFKSGVGCVPSVANAIANLWRVPPSAPAFISAETGSLGGSSVRVKVLALDTCGNALPLGGTTVTVWTENPGGTTPSTALGIGVPDGDGFATVSALAAGDVRAGFIAADVDGVATADADKATIAAVPILQPGGYTEDPGLENDDGINSIIYRGGDESGGFFDTVHVNPAMRLQTMDMSTYEINWMCTVGIIPACECPAVGTALSSTCGSVFETEKNMVLGTITAEGDMRNMIVGVGDVAAAGTLLLDLFGAYDMGQGSGGVLSVLSAQLNYEISFFSGSQDVDGTVHSGWLRQTAGEQEIETVTTGLELYNDRGNGDPSDDEIRSLILRVLAQRPMP